MKKFTDALKGAINTTIDAAADAAEGALAVTTEAVNNGVAVAKKTAETAATVATAAVEGAVAGVKQATSADKKSDE